ncbi:MAG: patatin-like phospholipase family protein [Acidaminococcaceae bacterium]
MSRRPKLGLVLVSGGLRGLAHAGVLSVLEENGIEVDIVAGCSIGSLIGVLISAGYDSDTIMKLAKGLGRGLWFEFAVHKKGFIGTENIYKIVTMLTKGKRIEELDKHFAAVATDLATGRQHVFRDGNSAAAICASVAVPGIFVPYEWEGRQMVDGAIVNPTPVSVAKDMGADVILAVDLAAVSTIGEVNTVFDVVLRSLDIMQKGLFSYQRLIEDCDILIQPELSSCAVTDFKKIEECYQVGRDAAWEILPKLLDILDNYSEK